MTSEQHSPSHLHQALSDRTASTEPKILRPYRRSFVGVMLGLLGCEHKVPFLLPWWLYLRLSSADSSEAQMTVPATVERKYNRTAWNVYSCDQAAPSSTITIFGMQNTRNA